MTTGRSIAALLIALPALHAGASFADPRETCTRRAAARPASLQEIESWHTPVGRVESRLPIQAAPKPVTVSPACLLVVPVADPMAAQPALHVSEASAATSRFSSMAR